MIQRRDFHEIRPGRCDQLDGFGFQISFECFDGLDGFDGCEE
jgi:hypothetical protein